VEDLFRRLFDSYALLFLLNALHQLLGICVLARHDVADAKISQDNRSDVKQRIHLSSYKRLIVADSVSVLIILHKEHMCNIQFPCLMLAAKLSALSEDLFNHSVVALVPVHLRLHHQNGNVLV